jgi:hypothetical protein
MLDWRLYRAAFVPFLLVLAVAALSLSARPRPLSSTLAPDAFDGASAFAELRSLASQFPDRRPGSAGDRALAARVASTIAALGAPAGGGFSVRTQSFEAQTIDGERTLENVIALRPGASTESPLVILAHRDAAGHGAQAELSGTAALLELARVFAARETQRTIVLVSTSGGSGGDAGARYFVDHAQGPFDAAIVLGDLAGARARAPFVVPFSDGFGSAPDQLQRTVAAALSREAGVSASGPGTLAQLAHLAVPFAPGEQGVLQREDLPAVLVQASGERGPTAGEAVSQQRLESLGRGVLSALDALDPAPDVPSAPQTGVLMQRKSIPEWALRLLGGALLLPPLLVAVDGLARARRRREPVARWALWTLSCALPFFACAVFVFLLGRSGVIAAPPAPPPASALRFGGSALRAVTVVALAFALAWLVWPALLRRLRLRMLPRAEGAGVALLLVLLALTAVVWVVNPIAALLLVPALHLWLRLASSGARHRPRVALALVALALFPLALLLAFYASALGLGPGTGAWMAVLLLAGGHVGLPAAALWSLAFGCVVAASLLALAPPAPRAPARPRPREQFEITVRGPLSYAGPGSLGGTESALRR